MAAGNVTKIRQRIEDVASRWTPLTTKFALANLSYSGQFCLSLPLPELGHAARVGFPLPVLTYSGQSPLVVLDLLCFVLVVLDLFCFALC